MQNERDRWDWDQLLVYAAGNLREMFEKRDGCNMGFETGCETHPKDCPNWPQVFVVWTARTKTKRRFLNAE